MTDIEGLKADPAFQKLQQESPERAQALLQHAMGRAAPASPGIGEQIQQLGARAERGYEQNIAQPGARLVGQAETFVGIPQWAQKGSLNPINPQNIVPQTGTGAMLDLATMALPEFKAADVLGRAAIGPVTKFIGSRLGRMATMGGIGAATEAATGGSPGSGAMQGALGEAGAQAVRGAAGMITRRMFKNSMLQKTTRDFGEALTKAMPWLGGKIETTEDFANQFIHGGAVNKAQILLNHTKGSIAPRVQGHSFLVPTGEVDKIGKPILTFMPFTEADKAITKLNRQGYLPVGDPRSGASTADWRAISRELRDQIVGQLNKTQKGLGDKYLQSRRQLDAAYVLGGHPDIHRGGVFRDPQIFDTDSQAINVPLAIERINKDSNGLQRSLGREHVDNMLGSLRRGAKGEVADVPSRGEEKARARIGVSPMGGVHMTAHPGHTYKAIGKTPAYYDPRHAPVEIMTQNIISDMRAKQPEGDSFGPGMKALDTHRAEALAPTPSASDRAGKVITDLRKGKTPDVHSDLNRGRLSLDETNKLISHVSDNSPAAMVMGLPLTEVMDSAEVASPEERQMLIPLIKQRLMTELPKIKNKTLQMNLAQRFQRLQTVETQAV